MKREVSGDTAIGGTLTGSAIFVGDGKGGSTV